MLHKKSTVWPEGKRRQERMSCELNEEVHTGFKDEQCLKEPQLKCRKISKRDTKQQNLLSILVSLSLSFLLPRDRQKEYHES